jgi:alpha/beta superfamily hydrolase
MNSATRRLSIAGPAGPLECALDGEAGAARGLALVCHPHPLFGGTMDNKVVMTLARAFVQLGFEALRFNFRGIGASAGAWDEGRGEIDDALAALHAHRGGRPLVLAGFSFGGYVAAATAARLPESERAQRLILAAPAVVNFQPPAVPADTLIVHGELDDVVPLQAQFDWARSQQLPVTVLPGAGHFFHGQLPLLKQIVLAAFVSQAAH